MRDKLKEERERETLKEETKTRTENNNRILDIFTEHMNIYIHNTVTHARVCDPSMLLQYHAGLSLKSMMMQKDKRVRECVRVYAMCQSSSAFTLKSGRPLRVSLRKVSHDALLPLSSSPSMYKAAPPESPPPPEATYPLLLAMKKLFVRAHLYATICGTS